MKEEGLSNVYSSVMVNKKALLLSSDHEDQKQVLFDCIEGIVVLPKPEKTGLTTLKYNAGISVVEARGLEPLSEDLATSASPGAVVSTGIRRTAAERQAAVWLV
jgi:hypothetical protein